MTSLFWRTKKTVSSSSGILLKMNSVTQKPVAPRRYHVSGGVQTVCTKPSVRSAFTRCGTVRDAPRIENADKARFHSDQRLRSWMPLVIYLGT